MQLTEAKNEVNPIKSRIAEKILEKLDKYWNELQSALPEAVLLDPSSKFSTFGSLVNMARDYLIAQATSVPSEEAFSVAKHTLSAVRNRLDDEKARASLCLKTWYDSGLAKTF